MPGDVGVSVFNRTGEQHAMNVLRGLVNAALDQIDFDVVLIERPLNFGTPPPGQGSVIILPPAQAVGDPSGPFFAVMMNVPSDFGNVGIVGWSAYPQPLVDGDAESDQLSVADELAGWLRSLAAAAAPLPKWERSAEALLTQLERLVAERDELIRRLAIAYNELDEALDKVDELEGIVASLRAHVGGRSRTPKSKRSKKAVAAYALVAATALGPSLAVGLDEIVSPGPENDPIEQTYNIAYQTFIDCDTELTWALPEGR